MKYSDDDNEPKRRSAQLPHQGVECATEYKAKTGFYKVANVFGEERVARIFLQSVNFLTVKSDGVSEYVTILPDESETLSQWEIVNAMTDEQCIRWIKESEN